MAEWWLTVETKYGSAARAYHDYRIAATQAEVEALAEEINAQDNRFVASAHDTPPAVALTDVRRWEAEALAARTWTPEDFAVFREEIGLPADGGAPAAPTEALE